ncbi:MAG TPA: type I 3-dehydroquinate dehydratase [Syntrophales bacterium]|nr:type I 3-dehydroquinate dehydratase [Syntrophales bacterium]HOX95673.1 type I 3-dehydroquinate dehydratase [Syntrophales bacterium]HPI57109.1 type I 3-dehydroquinate dehydratase [Syntrophales bacterium]HPN24804.1 type I 3-dehydroquinate dehydratase [Syntrophales bacterium]HQM30091.1 type I 3-dehydroquinate dehydratase [Syntrophales bacterium]
MICVSLLAKNRRDALRSMERAFSIADAVELRMDRMKAADLPVLIGARRGILIVTNRRKEEGGFFRGSERDRVNLLKAAAALGADFVDIEASTARALIGELAEAVKVEGGVTQIMVSSHDFSGTPPLKTLLDRLDSCRSLGAHVVKIVTYANTIEDNLRVLQLIPRALGEGQRIVAFCMGPKGRMSRIVAPLFGSTFSYASLRKGTEAAPGQLTVSEMREALRLFGGGGAEV